MMTLTPLMTVAASCPSSPCASSLPGLAQDARRAAMKSTKLPSACAKPLRTNHSKKLWVTLMTVVASRPREHCAQGLARGARHEAQLSARTQFVSAAPLMRNHLQAVWERSLMTLMPAMASCLSNPCASQSRAVPRPEFHLGPRCAKQLLPLCGELQCGPLNHLKMKNHLKTLWMMTLTTLMTRAAARPLSPCGSSSPGLAQGHAAQKLPSASVPVLPPPMGHSKALSTALMTWAP
mmetsp:Transcript_7442/g.12951  ORF Transcript_7442/g.12951 Transcript_7442/m.12951 type:complete len:236 (+) Transcript_7442:422-1129(+)